MDCVQPCSRVVHRIEPCHAVPGAQNSSESFSPLQRWDVPCAVGALDGRIIEANKLFLTLIGLTREDLGKRTVSVVEVTWPPNLVSDF